MKHLAKLVAGMLALALCAAPLQAVASCFSSTHCADCLMHCAHCCASMAKAAKMREALCHERVRILNAMLYLRWRKTLRSRLAGAGFKQP